MASVRFQRTNKFHLTLMKTYPAFPKTSKKGELKATIVDNF